MRKSDASPRFAPRNEQPTRLTTHVFDDAAGTLRSARASHDVVVTVNERGHATGTLAKLAAHQSPGVLHRAFSAFLFDRTGQLLIQRRASTKHHFSGTWSNSCCSHPQPGEAVVAAGRRRLKEELGIAADLHEIGTFLYHATDPDSGLVEHEFDHVLIGRYDGVVSCDPTEVSGWCWIAVDQARRLSETPGLFSPWFAPSLELVCRGL